MAVTRSQVLTVLHRCNAAGDLSPGSVNALADAFMLLIDDLAEAPVILESASDTFSSGYVAVAGGAVLITADTPNPGEIEFKV